jgi:hypothetical protein
VNLQLLRRSAMSRGRKPRAAIFLCLIVSFAPMAVAQTLPHQEGGVTKLKKINWETSDVLPPCFQVATVHGDPHTGAATFALKASAGCAMGWHWHSANELVSMVSGTFRLQMKDRKETLVMASTDFGAIPAKCLHREICIKECIAYVTIDGPFDVHYTDESGNEVATTEGVKMSSHIPKF